MTALPVDSREQTAVVGVVRSTGQYYADGARCIEIHIPKGATGNLPVRLGTRVALRLRVGEREMIAGLRATERNPYVWVSPDVRLIDGAARSLGSVLEHAGFNPGDRVCFTILDNVIALARAHPLPPAPQAAPLVPCAQRTTLSKTQSKRTAKTRPAATPSPLHAPDTLESYRFDDQQRRAFGAKFDLVRRDLVLASLATGDPNPALAALADEPGVYFLTMRLDDAEYKIYAGKTTSLPRRLKDYGKPFQVHSPNDFKLRALQNVMWQRFPQAAFDLYFARESSFGHTRDETAALRLYRPLVNEPVAKDVEARTAMKQAFETHYARVFARKIGPP